MQKEQSKGERPLPKIPFPPVPNQSALFASLALGGNSVKTVSTGGPMGGHVTAAMGQCSVKALSGLPSKIPWEPSHRS